MKECIVRKYRGALMIASVKQGGFNGNRKESKGRETREKQSEAEKEGQVPIKAMPPESSRGADSDANPGPSIISRRRMEKGIIWEDRGLSERYVNESIMTTVAR